MTTGGKRSGTVIVSVLIVILSAACGSSGSSKSGATATTKADPVADKALAQSLALTAADVPAGWVGSAHTSDAEDKKENAKLAACVGATNPALDTADIDGSDFDKGSSEIGSSVSIAATRAQFLTDVKALKSAKFASCAQSLLGTDLQATIAKEDPGVTIHDLKVTKTSVPSYGEISIAYRVSLTITGPDGKSLPLYIDQVQYGAGRSEVTLTFDGQGAPFDATLERSVIAKGASKLGKSTA